MNALLLTTLIASFASGDVVFIAGTEVNLRKSPSSSARRVTKLTIATACKVKGVKGDWVELTCGKHSGFTIAALLSATKPTAAALDARASSAKTPKEALKYRLRAAVLEENPARLVALREAWLAAEFALIKKSKRKIARIACQGKTCAGPLDKITGTHSLLVERDGALVVARLHGRSLRLTLGQRVKAQLDVRYSTSYAVEDVLARALKAVATPLDIDVDNGDANIASARVKARVASMSGKWFYISECAPDSWFEARFLVEGDFIRGQMKHVNGEMIEDGLVLAQFKGKQLQLGACFSERPGALNCGSGDMYPEGSPDVCGDRENEDCARRKTQEDCEMSDSAVCVWGDGSCSFSAP